jgi:hypothetical protein
VAVLAAKGVPHLAQANPTWLIVHSAVRFSFVVPGQGDDIVDNQPDHAPSLVDADRLKRALRGRRDQDLAFGHQVKAVRVGFVDETAKLIVPAPAYAPFRVRGVPGRDRGD